MNKLFLLLLIFTSCANNISKELKLLSSEPIKISTNLNVTYNGNDTIIYDIYNSTLKFIVYTDSTGCSSCNINKMYMWAQLLQYANSYDGKMKFYFIFRPRINDSNIVRTILTLNQINYPVFIDERGEFEKSNPHLPKNRAMHAFLLDENNKVILVGNPLYNKEIEKLFYKKTQELLSK